MADTDVVVHDFSDGSVDGSDAGIEDVCLDGGPDGNTEGSVDVDRNVDGRKHNFPVIKTMLLRYTLQVR